MERPTYDRIPNARKDSQDMKLKALLLAVFVAGFGASFALADDGGAGSTSTGTTTGTTTTGTTTTTTTEPSKAGCRKLELKGTLVSTAGSSFVMQVSKANHAGRALVGEQATVGVVAKTRVRWQGAGSFDGPKAGDVLKVLAAQCTATGNALVAFSVDARAPRAEKGAPAPQAKAKAAAGTTTTTSSAKGSDTHGKSDEHKSGHGKSDEHSKSDKDKGGRHK